MWYEAAIAAVVSCWLLVVRKKMKTFYPFGRQNLMYYVQPTTYNTLRYSYEQAWKFRLRDWDKILTVLMIEFDWVKSFV